MLLNLFLPKLCYKIKGNLKCRSPARYKGNLIFRIPEIRRRLGRFDTNNEIININKTNNFNSCTIDINNNTRNGLKKLYL